MTEITRRQRRRALHRDASGGKTWHWLARSTLLAAAVVGVDGKADTAILRPMADTSLFEFLPGNNLGAASALPAGTINRGKRSRLLMRCGTDHVLPAGARVSAVSLTLSVMNSGGVDSVFQLHRVLKSWAEGTKGATDSRGAAASDGEPTWTARAHPAAAWTEAGGGMGSDFSPDVSGAVRLQSEGAYAMQSTPALVADVQAWVDEPAANYGWVLLSTDEATPATAKRIASREDPANAPELRVDYTPPPGLPRFDGISRVCDDVRLAFPVESGKLYAVEYIEAVPGTNWVVLSYAASKFWPTNWVATDTRLASPQRFYRLAILGGTD